MFVQGVRILTPWFVLLPDVYAVAESAGTPLFVGSCPLCTDNITECYLYYRSCSLRIWESPNNRDSCSFLLSLAFRHFPLSFTVYKRL